MSAVAVVQMIVRELPMALGRPMRQKRGRGRPSPQVDAHLQDTIGVQAPDGPRAGGRGTLRPWKVDLLASCPGHGPSMPLFPV